MPITELDPLVAWKAIEGYRNELQGEADKLEVLYRHVHCPRCDWAGHKKEIDGRPNGHAYADPDVLVARALLRCLRCNCLYNPHTLDTQGLAMIVHRGDHGIHV